MFCENCGNPITDKDVYCMRCGAKINRETNGRQPAPVNDQWQGGQNTSVPVNNQWQGGQNTPTPVNNQWPGNQGTPAPENMSSKPGGIRNVYFIDFLCRLFSKENIPLCIYLVINMVIIGGIMSVMFDLSLQWGMLSGFFVYLATISIALSPIGEFIVRFQTGCKKIKDPEIMNRLEPIFYEVYQKAKMQEPLISDSVRLYMNEDESENAFAKRSEKEVDIAPMILDIHEYEAEPILPGLPLKQEGIFMKLVTGSAENLKPQLVMEAFCKYLGYDYDPMGFQYHRLETYLKKDGELQPLGAVGRDIPEEKHPEKE